MSTEHVRVHGNDGLGHETAAVAELPEHVVDEIRRAAARVAADKEQLTESRAAYRKTIADAHANGHSLAAIGRALGVSRQHVKRIIDDT